MDKTGCFWCALPEKGFGEKGKKYRGGKKGVNIAFIVNAIGESEAKPGNQKTPRCCLTRKGFQFNISVKVMLGCQVKSWIPSLKS